MADTATYAGAMKTKYAPAKKRRRTSKARRKAILDHAKKTRKY